MKIPHKDYMQLAFNEAFWGMRNNLGGLFGAIIIFNGEILGKGHNMVTFTNEPTAHTEIVAIRDVCRKVNTFILSEVLLYSSCESCLMCLVAIHWFNIKTVYFCSDREDVVKIGFNNKFIYDELNMKINERSTKLEKVFSSITYDLFNEWLKILTKL